MERLLDASLEQLQSAPEIGPVVGASVREFSEEPRNRRLIERLTAAGVNMTTRRQNCRTRPPALRQDFCDYRNARVDDP
jgi:NAD-dependent DNA ligase